MKGYFCLLARNTAACAAACLRLRSRLLFLSWPHGLLRTQERLNKPPTKGGVGEGDRSAPSWSQCWVHLPRLEGLGKRGSVDKKAQTPVLISNTNEGAEDGSLAFFSASRKQPGFLTHITDISLSPRGSPVRSAGLISSFYRWGN